MNYDKARQRASDLRWDYTSGNDGYVYPLGYCSAFSYDRPYDTQRDVAFGNEEHYNQNKAKLEPFKHKYHTDGHATPEEAMECYKQYMLDNRLFLDRSSGDTQHKCQSCGEWTQGMAQIGGWHYVYLCDKHRNREEVAKLFTVGESWHS